MRILPKWTASFCALSIYALFCSPGARAQKEELSALSGWVEWSDATSRLQRHLNSLAFQLLEKRQAAIRNLKSAEDWRTRIAETAKTLDGVVGPFPEKAPLNATVLGTVSKEGYTIEKVVFESMPHFYVTGCLFIPAKRSGPAPAILYLSGHTQEAFRNPRYQLVILNLAKKGFIVFAMDPIGQGERLQYYDPALKRSAIGGATAEHSYLGTQCFLSGSSAARYFTWDGIRAIDYLISRPEVDPKRIGVTGLSGGGTQTAYISALDSRVAAAAPTCYITSFRRLLESIGPQDAEQNFNAGLLHGIDHADLLEVRAPRPTLLVATTRDFFSIQGARETFAEARGAFRMLGAGDRLGMIEDDFEHGYTPKTREAIYSFFQKNLGNPGSSAEEQFQPLPVEDLTVTRTGQVADSLNSETVFTLNRAEAEKLIGKIKKSQGDLPPHLQRVRSEAMRLSGYLDPGGLAGVVFRGRYARGGCQVELYVLPGEGKCLLPVLLLLPEDQPVKAPLIYLHPSGKTAAAAPGGEAEGLVKQGYAVLVPDLSGTGENGQLTDATAFVGVQLGRSIPGIRAAEIVRCVQFLKSRKNMGNGDLGAIAYGELTVPLLHAAAFHESIKRIAIIEPPVSFQTMVMNSRHSLNPGMLISNALLAYDLPDLAASLAPRKLLMLNCLDELLKPAGGQLVEKSFQVIRQAYSGKIPPENLVIKSGIPEESRQEFLRGWLK